MLQIVLAGRPPRLVEFQPLTSDLQGPGQLITDEEQGSANAGAQQRAGGA